LRNAGGDFRGDLSVAASDIEDSLRVLKIEQSEYFLSHRFLQRRAAIVLGSVPFGHVRNKECRTLFRFCVRFQ
jgi:hypothetical protein